MNKSTFIDRTIKTLFNEHMPPGMEKAKMALKERQRPPEKLEQAAWQLYEYKSEDEAAVRKKVRSAAKQVVTEATHGAGDLEFGLLAPRSEDAEIEKTFEASSETRVLELARRYAEEQNYSIEEPPSGSESLLDWRFDGRRLTKLNR